MKVTRGRTFEKDGAWEKLEVELSTADLLPAEAALEPHLQPLLLEIRADQQLISFTHRLGEMTDEDMRDASRELREARRRVVAMSTSQVPARLTK
jgi:hypothetical protein